MLMEFSCFGELFLTCHMADGIAVFIVSVADDAALVNLDMIIALVVLLCQRTPTAGRRVGENEAVGESLNIQTGSCLALPLE